MTLEDFLEGVHKNAQRIREYQSGHDGSDGGCDCIGQIIGAVRQNGVKWPWTHGSNYAARNRINNLHYISKANEQQRGDIVFKARNPGEPKYDLPSRYNDSLDKKDYYHVGVVTRTNPLEITHCTSSSGCVYWGMRGNEGPMWLPCGSGIKFDKELGAWHYAGTLNQIKGGDIPMVVNYQATVVADNGNTVNLRANPSINSSVQKTVRVGTIVDVIDEQNSEWAKIKVDATLGYMMRKFLMDDNGDAEDQVVIQVPKEQALTLMRCIQSAVGE